MLASCFFGRKHRLPTTFFCGQTQVLTLQLHIQKNGLKFMKRRKLCQYFIKYFVMSSESILREVLQNLCQIFVPLIYYLRWLYHIRKRSCEWISYIPSHRIMHLTNYVHWFPIKARQNKVFNLFVTYWLNGSSCFQVKALKTCYFSHLPGIFWIVELQGHPQHTRWILIITHGEKLQNQLTKRVLKNRILAAPNYIIVYMTH